MAMRTSPPVSPTLIAQIDPRSRLIVVALFCVVVSILRSWEAIVLAAVGSVAAAFAAGWSLAQLAKRVLSLVVVLLPIALTVPLSTPGEIWKTWGAFTITKEGVVLAEQIVLKVCTLVVFTTSLLGTVNEIRLGHALAHLRVPRKLALLLIFVHRYLAVIFREYETLRTAMRARAFRPRLDTHTLRTFGHLVAMLVARSYDRSHRVLAAMKCRGFTGQFPLLFHFRYSWADVLFVAILLSLLALIGWLEWGKRVVNL